MKKKRVAIGDVFLIPMNDGKKVFGQVIAECNPRCYIIFEQISENNTLDNNIIQSNDCILFLTFTFDECLEKNIWPIVENVEPNKEIILPSFKVEKEDGTYIVDYAGTLIRKAKDAEVDLFNYRSYITPYVLETLVKFHFGYIPSITEYEMKVYKKILYRTT